MVADTGETVAAVADAACQVVQQQSDTNTAGDIADAVETYLKHLTDKEDRPWLYKDTL